MARRGERRKTIVIDEADAVIAFTAMRAMLRNTETVLAADLMRFRAETQAWRDEQWAAYQRLAAALGLKPTLD